MKTITYFYSCHSAYAYLGAWRLAEIAAETGAQVIHCPIELSPVMEAAGGLPFARRTQAHIDYFFGRELTRWAAHRDLPILDKRPTHHDNPLHPGNGIIIAAQNSGEDVDALSRTILQAHWRDDADMADPATLAALADDLGMNGGYLMEMALSDAVQSEHEQNTNRAIQLSVFGSPTYFVGDEMFYGQDRLEFVAQALSQMHQS